MCVVCDLYFHIFDTIIIWCVKLIRARCTRIHTFLVKKEVLSYNVYVNVHVAPLRCNQSAVLVILGYCRTQEPGHRPAGKRFYKIYILLKHI